MSFASEKPPVAAEVNRTENRMKVTTCHAQKFLFIISSLRRFAVATNLSDSGHGGRVHPFKTAYGSIVCSKFFHKS
jgi:hypothetical protein